MRGAKALTTLDNGHLSILCSWHLWKGDRENWEEKSLEDLRPLCQPTLNSQSVLKAKWYQSMKSHFIVITLTSTRKPWLGSTSKENNMFKTLWWHWLRNNQCIRHPVGTNLTPENSWTPYLNYCMPLPANIYIYITWNTTHTNPALVSECIGSMHKLESNLFGGYSILAGEGILWLTGFGLPFVSSFVTIAAVYAFCCLTSDLHAIQFLDRDCHCLPPSRWDLLVFSNPAPTKGIRNQSSPNPLAKIMKNPFLCEKHHEWSYLCGLFTLSVINEMFRCETFNTTRQSGAKPQAPWVIKCENSRAPSQFHPYQ